MANQQALTDKYSIGTVFSPHFIDDIKAEIEENTQFPLKKSFKENEIRLYCYRFRQFNCNYHLRFLRREGGNEVVGFELVELNHRHTKDCLLFNEDKAFHYAMNFLIQHKMRITFLISTYIDQNGTSIPTELLKIVASDFGFDNDFLFKGIYDKFLRRKIKKKFDNLVGEIKKNFYPHLVPKKRSKLMRRHRLTLDLQKQESQVEEVSSENFAKDDYRPKTEYKDRYQIKPKSEEKIKVKYEQGLYSEGQNDIDNL